MFQGSTRFYVSSGGFSLRTARRGYIGILAILLAVSSAHAQSQAAPIFQYAIFYNGLLEFSTCGNMVINGPVHCNTNIYVGAGGNSTLTFNSTVTAAGSISAPTNNGSSWGNPTNFSSTWRTSFNGNPPHLQHVSPVDLLLGTNNSHAIIEVPPEGEPLDSLLGQQRLYNQAHVILLVSNTTVTTMIRQSVSGGSLPGADPNPCVILCTNTPSALGAILPFVTLTNLFRDAREGKTNLTTQIDVGNYATWLATNAQVADKFPAGSGAYPALLFVADNRTVGANQLAAVRLTNGIVPPHNGGHGFSLATPNPLYIWGSFNCTNSAYLGSTNTTAALPCALYSDALTILSSNWKDTNSTRSLTYRVASSATTVNAAIITGIVPTTGPDNMHFSGGIQNLPRMLENWSSSTLWLNTSIVTLFDSAQATNQFLNPNAYYSPPTRQFSFDLNFTDPTRPLPSGTPIILLPPVVLAITNQPQSQSVGAGDDVLFSVGADGVAPFYYQWMFSQTAITGATNSDLLITNVGSPNAGTYSVVVSNFYGVLTSSNATLTVNYCPAVVVQPANQPAVLGYGATFEVTAAGTAPLTYQWYFNGTNLIAEATNSMLVLSNVSMDQAGSYSVTVTNFLGTVTSSPAVLTVYPSSTATLTSPSCFGSNQFQFTVIGVPGIHYAVEASTNLFDWIPLVINTSPFNFVDTNTALFPQRFFRAAFVP
jgi:hypothetical protein